MTPYHKRTSPICNRLAQDMRIRHLSTATIDAYTYHVDKFDQFLETRSVEQASPEDIRNFQLHLIEVRKVGYSSFNQAVCGLRFLYSVTIPRDWPVVMIPFGKRAKTLPTVLSVEEVNALLQCTPNLKHRTFFMALYAAGLRLSEAANLSIRDIDSQRMQLNIQAGKGKKQRQVPLSPRLLEALREYWKQHRPTALLFPGKRPDKPYAGTSIQKTIKASAKRAKINKNVTPHTLRHSYATGLLEAGVDILTISRLLGHSSFTTTMVYLHVRRTHLLRTPSPLDWLPTRQLPKWEDPTSDDPPKNGPLPKSSLEVLRSTSPLTRVKRSPRFKARWRSYRCAERPL